MEIVKHEDEAALRVAAMEIKKGRPLTAEELIFVTNQAKRKVERKLFVFKDRNRNNHAKKHLKAKILANNGILTPELLQKQAEIQAEKQDIRKREVLLKAEQKQDRRQEIGAINTHGTPSTKTTWKMKKMSRVMMKMGKEKFQAIKQSGASEAKQDLNSNSKIEANSNINSQSVIDSVQSSKGGMNNNINQQQYRGGCNGNSFSDRNGGEEQQSYPNHNIGYSNRGGAQGYFNPNHQDGNGGEEQQSYPNQNIGYSNRGGAQGYFNPNHQNGNGREAQQSYPNHNIGYSNRGGAQGYFNPNHQNGNGREAQQSYPNHNIGYSNRGGAQGYFNPNHQNGNGREVQQSYPNRNYEYSNRGNAQGYFNRNHQYGNGGEAQQSFPNRNIGYSNRESTQGYLNRNHQVGNGGEAQIYPNRIFEAVQCYPNQNSNGGKFWMD